MAHEDLFPREFLDRIKRDIPKAEEQLNLAQRRIDIARAAGADVKTQELDVVKLRNSIAKMRAAFRL